MPCKRGWFVIRYFYEAKYLEYILKKRQILMLSKENLEFD